MQDHTPGLLERVERPRAISLVGPFGSSHRRIGERVVKSFRLCWLALLVSLLFVGLAHAQDDDETPYSRSGFYAGAGATGALEDVGGFVQNSPGANLRLGYRINKRAAVEVEGEWVGDFVSGVDFNVWTTTASVKGYLAFGRFQPFLLLGIGALIGDPDPKSGGAAAAGFAFRTGIGLEAYITHNIAILLDGTYVAPVSGHVKRLDYGSLSLGAIYRF